METPLSSRRITRSQALAMSANNKTISISSRENGESLKSRQRTNGGKQEEREKLALFDITNSSPIVGLARGNLNTPSSTLSKNRMITQNSRSKQITTPGSGEALLRDQVKTLLQKVEEEAVISKISFEHKPLIHRQGGFVNSPMALLAPTPANTPQVSDFSASNNNTLESFTVSPVAENFNFSQMLNEIIGGTNQQEETDENEEKNMITRSLFMDFSEKFEGSQESDCTSVLTYQGCANKSSSVDSDDSSLWSVQVNASTSDEYKGDEQSYEDDEDHEEVDENGVDEGLDDLCEGMSRISVNGDVKFTGKHTRFVYNSDGELEGEEEELESTPSSSMSASGILCLKGLPTPKGKHLRFSEESC